MKIAVNTMIVFCILIGVVWGGSPSLMVLDVCPDVGDCTLESKILIINKQVRGPGIENFEILYPEVLYNSDAPVVIKIYFEDLEIEERPDVEVLIKDS